MSTKHREKHRSYDHRDRTRSTHRYHSRRRSRSRSHHRNTDKYHSYSYSKDKYIRKHHNKHLHSSNYRCSDDIRQNKNINNCIHNKSLSQSKEKLTEKNIKSTRQNKHWKEWEERFVISERNKILNNCNKNIKKITEKDWKLIALKLEIETNKKIKCETGRNWKSVKERFNNKISTNVKYFDNINNENIQKTNTNIRQKLQTKLSYRGTFLGEFQSFGDEKGKKNCAKKKKKYICLINIRSFNNLNEMLCDHVWLNVGKQINDLGWVKKGITIQFDARIAKYRKGSIKRGIKVVYDYKFTYPSKVKFYKDYTITNNKLSHNLYILKKAILNVKQKSNAHMNEMEKKKLINTIIEREKKEYENKMKTKTRKRKRKDNIDMSIHNDNTHNKNIKRRRLQ